MRGCVLTLVATLAVAGTGCGTPTSAVRPESLPSSSAEPAAHARFEADRLLQLVRVPPGSTLRSHSPATILDQPSQTTATDDIIDEHRWWTVSSDAETTLSWLTKNGVQHLKSSGSGTSDGPAGVTEYTLVFDDRAPAGIDSEELQLDVAPMADGSSAIRADAQVVWLPDRSPDETIPRDINRIDVSAYTMKGRIAHRILTGAKARHLADIINALPTAVRAEGSCGMDQGYRLRVAVGSLLFDEDVACSDITVTDDGSSLPALGGDPRFVHAVASSMGLPDYPPAPTGKPSPAAR